MNMHEQVTSLALSKKLKEVGVTQESQFYWSVLYRPAWEVIYLHDLTIPQRKSIKSGTDGIISAFTVAELGEWLPEECYSIKYSDDRTSKPVWGCTNRNHNYPVQEADTEADARAKMLIYLVEQGLLKVPVKH